MGNALLSVAVILMTGLLFGRVASMFKLPSVTGYLVGGLLIGPSFLNLVTTGMLEGFGIISQMALAFIAFSIGLSFKTDYFKRVGMTPVVIAFFEATLAVVLVTGALLAIGVEPAFAIVLGSIAAATAPAATVMVIKEYKAKGPVTDTLLSVVALDDAVALILFGFAAAIAEMLTAAHGATTSLVMTMVAPFLDVLLALAAGAVLGFVMQFPLKHFKTRANRLAVLLAFVFLTSGLSTSFGVSELLACMMAGGVLTNVSKEAPLMTDLSDRITPPLYMMFFVVSGAGLNISILPSIGLIGVVYILFRVAGKMLGAYTGARIMKAPKEVSNYLGITLIPQAGVAIGLATASQTLVPAYAEQITAVVLAGTLVYELVGPVLTKWALTKAGDIEAPVKDIQAQESYNK